MNAIWTEIRMVASTVLGLIPGRLVWIPKSEKSDLAWISSARRAVLELASNELRAAYSGEVEGLERVRQRAQFALTALVAAAGFSATTAQETLIQDISWTAKAIWIAGFAIVVLACLVFAGVFVSRKIVGIPTVNDLGALGIRAAQRQLAESYVRAIESTRATRNAAVTVFRDGVLLGLVGLALIVSANGVVVLTSTPETSQTSPATSPTVESSPAVTSKIVATPTGDPATTEPVAPHDTGGETP